VVDLHERVRFKRGIVGVPEGATGTVVEIYEGAGGVAVKPDDPNLDPSGLGVVDVPPGSLDALEPLAG
jgi:hypothetical protein